MVNNFPKIQNFYRLSEKSEFYKLFEIKNKKIIDKFYSLLNKLESQPQTIVCTRGDSKSDSTNHDNFLKCDLNKIFTVGGKANYHFNTVIDSIYAHTYTENVDILRKELEELWQKVVNAMNQRAIEFGTKEFLHPNLDLQKLNLDLLLKLKIFVLHFLHTDGRLREFSQQSPFLSMTYGKKRFSIARKFALGMDTSNLRKKGFVYLYSLNTADPFYLKTKELSFKLNRIGVVWHCDKYNEILLFSGMFPHYILGIFEVQKYKTPRFIINPYLYDILRKNEKFDDVNGLSIDQKNFIEYAKSLGYENYFYKTKANKVCVDRFDDSNPLEVIRA